MPREASVRLNGFTPMAAQSRPVAPQRFALRSVAMLTEHGDDPDLHHYPGLNSARASVQHGSTNTTEVGGLAEARRRSAVGAVGTGPSIMVTPDVAVLDGDFLQVSGLDSFATNLLAISQCRADADLSVVGSAFEGCGSPKLTSWPRPARRGVDTARLRRLSIVVPDRGTKDPARWRLRVAE
jgi:hypothetical protein